MFFSQEHPSKARALKLAEKPPKGMPESVAVPGTELPGRSRVYRHWQIGGGELLKTLDPNVSLGRGCAAGNGKRSVLIRTARSGLDMICLRVLVSLFFV